MEGASVVQESCSTTRPREEGGNVYNSGQNLSQRKSIYFQCLSIWRVCFEHCVMFALDENMVCFRSAVLNV